MLSLNRGAGLFFNRLKRAVVSFKQARGALLIIAPQGPVNSFYLLLSSHSRAVILAVWAREWHCGITGWALSKNISGSKGEHHWDTAAQLMMSHCDSGNFLSSKLLDVDCPGTVRVITGLPLCTCTEYEQEVLSKMRPKSTQMETAKHYCSQELFCSKLRCVLGRQFDCLCKGTDVQQAVQWSHLLFIKYYNSWQYQHLSICY